MVRNVQVNFKTTVEEREYIDEVCEEVDLSRADLYLEALDFLINSRPKAYKKLIKKGKEVRNIKSAKSSETDSGDFLGSFDKFDEKIKRIEAAFEKEQIDEELRDILIEDATENYKMTQKIHKKKIKRRSRKR